MEKYSVSYSAGESRLDGHGVDLMLCAVEHDGEDFELYAEAEPIGHYEGGEWVYDDECGTFEELKAEIIRQAAEIGIQKSELDF